MWLIYAMLAACTWGLDYVLGERIFKYKISPVSLIVLQTLIGFTVFSVVGFCTQLRQDMVAVLSDRNLLWLTLAAAVTFNTANLLIFLSIQAKNSTLAALVELSYPIFTVIFAWILFNQNHLSTSIMVGGSLIFLGVIIIAYFN